MQTRSLRSDNLYWMVQELRELPRQSKLFSDVPDNPKYVEKYLWNMLDNGYLHGVVPVSEDRNGFLLFCNSTPWYADRLEVHEMILWVPERERGGRTAFSLVQGFKKQALELQPHSIHAGHTLDITDKERTLSLYERAGFSRHAGGVIMRP